MTCLTDRQGAGNGFRIGQRSQRLDPFVELFGGRQDRATIRRDDMRTRMLQARYRTKIEKLTKNPRGKELWLNDLRNIAQQFQHDIASLDTMSAAQLLDELGERFDQEALRSTNPFRRDVLSVAAKYFDPHG